MKAHLNNGKKPDLCFYRDDSKMEVDVIDLTDNLAGNFFEVKSGETFKKSLYRTMNSVCNSLDVEGINRNLVMRIPESFESDGVNILSADKWAYNLV